MHAVANPVAALAASMDFIRTQVTAHAAADTPLGLMVRGKVLPARVVKLPFVPHNYYRG